MALRLSSGLVNNLLDTGSFKTVMNDSVLYLYSGLQPAGADLIETTGAVVLAIITVGGAAFVSGAPGNGLGWDDATLNVIPKAAGETWKGIGLVAGTAGWFRFYGNTVVFGASTSAIRFDGRISATGGGGELELSSTAIAVGAYTTITTATFTIPLGS